MMPGDPRLARAPKWTGLRILLVASLALNLLVIGVAVGAALRWGGDKRADRPPPPVTAALYRALPRADRAGLRAEITARHGSRLAQRHEDARALAAALRERPFDAAAVETILRESRTRRDMWQDAVHRAWLTRVRAMDDAARDAYAARLERAMWRSRDAAR